MEEKITQLLSSHIESAIMLADQLPPLLVRAGTRLTQSLLNDGKLLICAHGRAYPNGIHFASSMLNRYEVERPALPVLMLGMHVPILQVLIKERHEDQVFSREIQAFAAAQDVLLVLSASANAPALVQALQAAKEKGVDSIVICGEEEGVLAHYLGPEDCLIQLPSAVPSRIIELQLMVLHGFCAMIDALLFGESRE